MSASTVLIMAGGTGGHVFPGLAIAEELMSRNISVEWLGTESGIESTLVPERDIVLHCIPVRGVRGKGLMQLLSAPLNIAKAVAASMKIIKSINPGLVLGFGGYVSGPGGVAARISGIPLVIHEQNAIAGTTNRILAKLARRVFSAFPCDLPKAVCVGNPIRREIEDIAEPSVRMQQRTDHVRVLVLGGSRGAVAINSLAPQAFARVDTACSIWHQTGAGKLSETEDAYRGLTHEVKVAAFIDDIASAYAWADLAICRSGALTVSELAAAGLASVLIPFPHAIDDHQTKNAMYLVHAGAALVKQQHELDVDLLAELFNQLFLDRSTLLTMASKARRVAKPRAAVKVADYCEDVLNGSA